MKLSLNFAESFEALKAKLQKRRVDLKKRHFVICPDKCSIFLERVLFEDTAGAFDVDILSFDRLFDRVVGLLEMQGGNDDFCYEHLSGIGAVMLIKKILVSEKKHLQVFSRASNFKGFSEQIYDTICALSACRIEPSDLVLESVSTATELKLKDIAHIYNCYKNETQNKFIDTAGKMHILLKMLQCVDLSNVSFYVVGFNRFSGIENSILGVLESSGVEYSFFDVEEPKYNFGEADFFECDSVCERIIAVSCDIQNQIMKGIVKYSDFCVLASESIYSPLERIFTEYNIPFYIDKKMPMVSSELFKFLDLSVRCSEVLQQVDMIALSKNAYLKISTFDSDCFENFVLEHRINFVGFGFSFIDKVDKELKDDSYILTAESVRIKLLEHIEDFKKQYLAVKTAKDFVKFLEGVFIYYDVEAITSELSLAVDLDFQSVITNILECGKSLAQVIKGGQRSSYLYTLFKEGLSSINLSLLPKFSDCIVVGEPSSFRGGRFKAVYALEFEDGKLPELVSDTGLIGISDIEHLRGKNVKFEPSSNELNKYNLDEVVRLFESSERLFLSYGSSTEERISNLAIDVKKGSKQVRKLTNKDLDCGGIVNEGENCVLSDDVGVVVDYVGVSNRVCSDTISKAGEMFFDRGLTSITRLEKYFSCPYKHFVDNVLGLVERKTGVIEAKDIGNFLHRTAEEFVKKGEFSKAEASMERIAKGLLEGEFKSFLDKNKYVAHRILDESIRLSTAIANSFLLGCFYNNGGVEVRFGKKDCRSSALYNTHFLEGLSFTVNNREIVLEGKIDRVDVFLDTNTNKKYARIIDYKTGKADFNYDELYYGLKLQLPLYSKVLQNAGYATAGFFYFLLSHGFGTNANSPRLVGVYNNNDLIVNAFDIGLINSGYRSSVIKAERTQKNIIHGRYAKAGRSGSDIVQMLDYSNKVLAKALDEIALGFIAPKPIFKGEKSSCDYCAYSAMCGIANSKHYKRNQDSVTYKNFFEVIGGEC
ncbi:MAG: PD-(D/E)XK nuclease family protein [Firmicutes bacterium]|nr:PD-(D/E)XK nuclease family protein [Bacillota bacterium]